MINFIFREANVGDVDKIYDLSNEYIVRKNSINTEKINYNNHVKWYDKILNDKNYILLVVELNNEFIGQVKFQIEDKTAIISTSISPDQRGKGYSKDIISQSVCYLKSINRDIKVVIAYIKPENIPSIKSFEKSGFIIIGKEILNNNEFLKYKYFFDGD